MTLRALAAERDGRIVGIGGYYIQNGFAIAFTDSVDVITRRDIVTAGREFMKFLGRLKVEVVAQCNPAIGDTALRHFGFRPYHDDAWRLVK